MPDSLTNEASVLLSAVQERIVAAIEGFKSDLDLQPPSADQQNLLITLLNDPKVDFPDVKQLDLSQVLDRFGLDDGFFKGLDSVIDGGHLSLKNLGQLDLSNLSGLGQRLLTGNVLSNIKKDIDGLLQGRGRSPLPSAIHGILGRQASIGISFLTTLKNLANAQLPDQIVQGWMQYFFAGTGYETLDGVQIVAPGRAALSTTDLNGLQQGLKGLLNERSAQQYVRDLVRILVEIADNMRYDLEKRLPKLKAAVNPQAQAKAVRWFTGAGSMAESLVTSAIEELSLGVAQFQTNPVIAAAAATYAGTAARKASQHLFLSQAGV